MEVLPPPQTTSEVSAPTSREAYTRRSRPSSVPASASFQRDFMRAQPYHSSGQTSGAREARPRWVSFARDGSARNAVHLDPIATARRRGRQRLNAVGVRGRRRVEAAGVAEDRAALVLRLVRAVARTERRPREATEERALAGAVAALDHRAARSAQ